jgi:hypothetical protein
MSHITKVKTHLKDRSVLIRSLKKLGYRICEGDSRPGLSRLREIRNLDLIAGKNGLWIGFRRAAASDGPYEMLADWPSHRGRKEEVVREVHQIYSQEKILELAKLKGYALMKNRMNEKGQIEIVLRKVG